MRACFGKTSTHAATSRWVTNVDCVSTHLSPALSSGYGLMINNGMFQLSEEDLSGTLPRRVG